MIGRHLLDDLDEGESRIRVDIGNLLVCGTYQGLEKSEIEPGAGKRWWLKVKSRHCLERVATKDIIKIERLR